MPEILGRLRTPRLASAPATPQAGEMYYSTATNKLYWWNGTAWIDSTGGSGGTQIPTTYTITAGYTKDRAMNPAAMTLGEVATVLATLVDDMKAAGMIAP